MYSTCLLSVALAKDSEPSGSQVEPLFGSLIRTYDKLIQLGFTYYNGKVAVIEENKEEDHV